MYTIQTESFTECLPELQDLFEIHYQEIGDDPENIRLNPDYEVYFTLEDNGMLHLATVREDNTIVGYYLSVITPLLHFKHITNAHNDAIFIRKEHRKGSLGLRLLKFVAKELTKLGVHRMTVHTKTKQPFDKLCIAAGMECFERHYCKRLGT